MKKFLIFIFLFTFQLGLSQEKPSPYKFTSLVDLYEFPTSNHTGNLDVNLPLYTINTRGLELPLSLNYDQMGNTNVFYIGNQFGDAWVLNAIGTISRKCEYRPTAAYETGIANSHCAGTYRYHKYRNNSLQNDEYYYYLNPTATTRPQPDVYTFSFQGLTGKFVINKQGSQFVAKVTDASDFVDIKIGTARDENNNFGSITITDKKGYRYLFTSPSNVNANLKTNVTYAANSVTVPSGCTLGGSPGETAYTGPSIVDEGGGNSTTVAGGIISSQTFLGDSKFWENLELTEIYDKYNNLLLKFVYEELGVSGGDLASSGINSLGMQMPRKKLYLKKIEIINQGAVNFNNTIGTNSQNVVPSFTNSIEVKNLKQELIKKIDFGYQITSPTPSLAYFEKNYPQEGGLFFHKRLLNSIKEFDTANQKNLTTSIEYKTPSITNDSRIVDKRGFLAGIDYCLNHTHMTTTKRDYILQKIKYPTGGSVLYQFEPNTFSKSQLHTAFKSENFDNHQFQQVAATPHSLYARSFIITNINPGDTLAIINHDFNVALGLYGGTHNFTQGNLIQRVSSKHVGTAIRLNETHCKHHITKVVIPSNTINTSYTINYPQGSQTLASFKVYKYSNNLVSNFSYVEGNRIQKIAYFTNNMTRNSLENVNGDSSAEKVVTFSYEDDTEPNKSSGRVSNFYRNAEDMSKYNFFYENVQTQIRGVGKQKTHYSSYPDSWSWMEHVRYDVNKSVVYDLHNNIISEKNQNNTYSYDSFDGGNLSKPFIKLNTQVSKNYENGNYIETTSETNFETNRQVGYQLSQDALGKTNKSEFTYQTINNAILNTQSNNYVNGNLKEQILNTYDSSANLVSSRFKTPEMSTYEQTGMLNPHYYNGLLLGYTQLDGTFVTLIYGYNDTQLVAKMINVDPPVYYADPGYGSIRSNISIQSNQNHVGYSEANLKTTLNGLRTTFPNALVTTYTYKPMVGISSITDENGKTSTFEYDTFNRLSIVKDHIGNILNEYQYNFTN